MSSDSITSLFAPDQVVVSTDGDKYKAVIRRWCENAEKHAKYVVLPKNSQEVSDAIKYATSKNLEIAIKGGGHSTSGASSSDDIVIDLAHISSVSVDAEQKLITVGGGALWAAVDEEAAKHGLATVGGTVNHTGVGGLTVGGGYGWLSAKYGLTIDILVEAEVVLANGEILTCNETQNEDLFWGIRGGGSNFGIVTKFVFKAFPQTNPVWAGLLIFPPPKLEALLKAAEQLAENVGEDASAMLAFARPPPALEPVIALIPFFNGSAEEGRKKFSAFYDVGPVADLTQEIAYPALNAIMNDIATYGDRKSFKAAVFTSFDPVPFQNIFNEYVKLTNEVPETQGSAVILEFHPYEKITSVPTSATAFANRGKWYNVNYSMRWQGEHLDQRVRSWSAEQAEYLQAEERKRGATSFASKNAYSNYGIGDERSRDVFGENYERLQEIKAKYDPNNVFHKWFPITPKSA